MLSCCSSAHRGGRKPKDQADGVFKTAIDRNNQGVTINALWRRSRVKQHLKDGRALRVETVVNSPDLGCGRLLPNLNDLQARARDCNRRLLRAERAGQGCVLASPVFERIAYPTVDAAGRRAPAMRFGDPRVQALAGALLSHPGRRHRHHQQEPACPDDRTARHPYNMAQASYDLARLRRNGLITRRPHANTYDLTPDGLAFALFYTKVHDRVLTPLFAAGQPQTPPQLRAAFRTIHQLIDDRLARARLPTAAWQTQLNCRKSLTQRVATLRPGLRPEDIPGA
jgi:hypothetical protein